MVITLLEVLSLDFVRTAKAKGLGKMTVIFKHALTNSLNPVVTAVSGLLALFFGHFLAEFGLKTPQFLKRTDYLKILKRSL